MREAVLDANVLLRYLTDEPREQADEVMAILDLARSQQVGMAVTSLTLAEVVFVLESVYEWERHTIAERLTEVISSEIFMFFEPSRLLEALSWYKDIRALHFADAYVAAVAHDRSSAIISFDRGMRRAPGVPVIRDAETLRSSF